MSNRIEDVPCVSCLKGYSDMHRCDSPEFCMCDQPRYHLFTEKVEQRFNLYCPMCGTGFLVSPETQRIEAMLGRIDVEFKPVRVAHQCPIDRSE